MKVNEKIKKVWSILLTFCMLMSSLPVTTLAEENAANGLCEHHQVHTAECGYVEAVSGTPCTHTCEESCYILSTACVHTHDGTCSYQAATAPTPCGHVHDESCGYAVAVAEVTCACVPGEDGTLVHTECCGYAAPVAEQPCTHTHDGNCGYSEGTAEVPCDHVCGTDTGCVTSVPDCQHVHDGNCGYTEAVEGHECHFACGDCAQGETSGETDSFCNCGTDDEAYHATTCAVYVAPENPVCYCTEKCTEANIWCDVCGFDYTQCGGTDTAAVYELAENAPSVLTVGTVTVIGGDELQATTSGEGWNYDSDANILTLNNATITGGQNDNGAGIYFEGGDLTINVVGKNTVNYTSIGNSIYFKDVTNDRNLTITGDGSLELFGVLAGVGSNARINIVETMLSTPQIEVSGDVTITNSTVSAVSARRVASIFSGANVTISNSYVVAESSTSYGILCNEGGTLKIENSQVAIDGGVFGAREEYSNSVVTKGSTTTVYGTATLKEELSIEKDETIEFTSGASITNKDKLEVESTATIKENGTIHTHNKDGEETYGKFNDLMHSIIKACKDCPIGYIDKSNRQKHTGTATCIQKAVCDICGESYGEVNPDNHASDVYTYTDNDDGTHTKKHECGVTVGEPEAHIPVYTLSEAGDIINVSCSANCGCTGTAAISAVGKTYDGTAVEIIVTKTGSLEGTDIPVTLTKDAAAFTGDPVNAGNYTASITWGEGENAVTASVDFTINRKAVTVTADDASKEYGEPDPTLTYVVENLVDGETLNGTLSRATGENAGTYVISQGILTNENNPNYNITFVDGTLTINPTDNYTETVTTTQDVIRESGAFGEPAYTGINNEPVVGTFVFTYDGNNYYYDGLVEKLKTLQPDTTVEVGYTFTPTDDNYTGSKTGTLNLTIHTVKFTVNGNPVTANNAYSYNIYDNLVYGYSWEELIALSSHLTANLLDATDTNSDNFGLNVSGTPDAGEHTVQILYNGTLKGIEYKNVIVCEFTVTIARKEVTVTAPVDMTLDSIPYDLVSAINELPKGVSTDDGDFDITWTCENYSDQPSAENTFRWEITDEDFKNYAATQTNGTIIVTNREAYAVTHVGANQELTYNGSKYDVAKMFTMDDRLVANITKADPAYTIVGGTGAGSLEGSVLTITKAGTIEIKLTTEAFGIYAAGEVTATLTVNKANGAGSVTMDDWTYGDDAKAPITENGTGTATFLYTGTDYSSAEAPTNVGTYTVTATFAENDLYKEATATDTFIIAKAPLTVTAKDNNITYGDVPANDGVSYTGFVSNENEDVLGGALAYSYNYEQYGNVGTYAIIPTGLTSDNYEITFVDGTLTVNEKPITVTAEAKSKTYGETDPELTYVLSENALVNGDTMSGALTRAAGANVGIYAITQGTLTAGSNYTISFTDATLTINAKAITEADVKLSGSLNYNGSEQIQAVTVTEGITYDVTGNRATDVATYELTVKGTGNYTGEVNLSWSIKEVPATVITVPAANTLTYTGEAQALITAGTASGGEMQYSLDGENWSTDIPTVANAGTYKVSYKVVGDANHSGTNISVVDVTIKQKEVDPSVSGSYTKAYDGTDLMLEAGKVLSLTLTGVITGDSLAATADYAFTGADAGTTTVNVTNITLTGDDAKNYKLTTDTLSLDDVGKIVPLDINSGMISVYLGDELVYNGTQQIKEVSKVTVEYDRGNGTVYDVTFEVTGNTGTDAGDYTMTIEGTGNYTGSVTKDWSIGQKEITAADVKLSGSLNYNGSEQIQAVTVTEGITYDVTGNRATDVGTYELTVKGTGNYTGEVNLSWSIKEVPATVITAPAANTLTYTGEAQALITAGTTADGAMVYSITEDGEYSEIIPTGTNADTYSVWYKVLGDANHTDSDPVSISVRIQKAEAAYSAPTANTLTYSGEAQPLLTAGATENGTLMYKLGTEGSYSTSIPNGTEADTYAVYYYVKGDTNYKDSSEQKIEVTIDKLDITELAEIAVGADLTYNGKEQTKSVASVKMGELDVTYIVSGNTGTDAGDYTMTVTANGNYKGIVTKDWSISKKKVTILANAQTITYGNTISDTEFTSDGLIEGHSVTVVMTPSTANVTVDGNITASDAVLLANGAARTTNFVDVTANYDISYGNEPAKLVIEPDTSRIDSLITENVTSANEADIKAVQTMMENAESIKEEWGTISETCKELIQKIEAVKAENTRISDAVSGFDLTSVKSSDEETINQLLADIEVQLSTSNLTDEEKNVLEGQKTKCSNLIAKIDGTETLITQLDKNVEDLDTETVKSTDKAVLEQVIADAQTLIDGGNVTDAEKEALKQTQVDAEALLDVIEKAQNAADTENTEKVENVTSENVKPTDKETLEDAKADLEKALADNSGNYTETEKQAIQSELDRVSEALEVVQNVEGVTSQIGELPNKLNADDKDLTEDIKAAKEAYDNLTAYEKSLIDKNTKEKLNELITALEKAEESEKETEKETEVEAESGKTDATEETEETKEAAETGDDSHAEMWMFTMLGSLLVLLILGKKRYGFLNK